MKNNNLNQSTDTTRHILVCSEDIRKIYSIHLELIKNPAEIPRTSKQYVTNELKGGL